jgi:hypothetical protein
MNLNKRTEAVAFLKNDFINQNTYDPGLLEEWYDIIQNDEWWIENRYHFMGGMSLRNHLRSNGFGEKELQVENLDDYYIDILEEAVKLAYQEVMA